MQICLNKINDALLRQSLELYYGFFKKKGRIWRKLKQQSSWVQYSSHYALASNFEPMVIPELMQRMSTELIHCTSSLMAYLHCRIRIPIPIANQMATLYNFSYCTESDVHCQLQEWDRNRGQNQSPDLWMLINQKSLMQKCSVMEFLYVVKLEQQERLGQQGIEQSFRELMYSTELHKIFLFVSMPCCLDRQCIENDFVKKIDEIRMTMTCKHLARRCARLEGNDTLAPA